MSKKPGQAIKLYIKLCKNMWDNLFLFYLQVIEAILEHSQTFMVGLFCENN